MAGTPTIQHLPTEIPENKVSRFLFADTRLAWVWLAVRLYVGWGWLNAGWEKLHNPALTLQRYPRAPAAIDSPSAPCGGGSRRLLPPSPGEPHSGGEDRALHPG